MFNLRMKLSTGGQRSSVKSQIVNARGLGGHVVSSEVLSSALEGWNRHGPCTNGRCGCVPVKPLQSRLWAGVCYGPSVANSGSKGDSERTLQLGGSQLWEIPLTQLILRIT